MPINNRWNYKLIFENKFIKNVAVLAGGTVVAQAITLIALPAITRLYTPEQYGIYGAFISVLSIILVVASLRYELAISLPEDDVDAANLMGLSIIIVIITSLISSFIIWLFWPFIIRWTNTPGLKDYLFFLPIAVLGAGSYQVISFWSVRKKTFGILARTKLTQSIGKVVTQLGLGFTGLGVMGLLVGQLIGDSAGSGVILSSAIKGNKQELKKISLLGLKRVAQDYWRFPVYATPSKLLNVATTQIPLLCILSYYGAEHAGWYSLVLLVLGAPISLITISVQNVFWSEASRLVIDDPLKLRQLFYQTSQVLVFISIVFALIAFLSPWIFSLLFGQAWLQAGYYARNMEFMFITQIIVMPLSILAVQQLQHWETAWNILCFITTVTCFGIGIRLNVDLLDLLLLYSLLMGVNNLFLYGLNILAINQRVNKVDNDNAQVL